VTIIFQKFNRKSWLLIIVCVILAFGVTRQIEAQARESVKPEPKATLWVFNQTINKDKEIERSMVEEVKWPVSAIPRDAMKDIDSVVGKRLAIGVYKGQPIFENQLVLRGEDRLDTSNWWECSIDIKNISNFIGTQLKMGQPYILMHRKEGEEATFVNEIIVAGLVSANGNMVTDASTTAPKSLIIGVKEQEGTQEIVTLKETGSFELVKAPTHFEFIKPVATETLEEGVNETMAGSEDQQ